MVLRASPKVFPDLNFVGFGSRDIKDPSSDAPAGCGILACRNGCDCVGSMGNMHFVLPLEVDGSDERGV